MSSFESLKNKLLNFKGPVVAPVTLFEDQTKKIQSPGILLEYVTYLKSIGVRGFFINSTTAEGLSLTHEEKKQLIKNWVELKNKLCPDSLLVVNISSTCVQECVELAVLCQTLAGVDAIAVLPSLYYRPWSIPDLVKYMSVIGSAAPETPLVYYHHPEKTMVDFNMVYLAASAIKHIPTFAGMKYASYDTATLAHLQRTHGDQIKVFAGFQETCLSAAINGVTAGVSGQFNFREGVTNFNRIHSELTKGELGFLERVQETQKQLTDMEHQLRKGSIVCNTKTFLQQRVSFAVGKARPPLDYD